MKVVQQVNPRAILGVTRRGIPRKLDLRSRLFLQSVSSFSIRIKKLNTKPKNIDSSESESDSSSLSGSSAMIDQNYSQRRKPFKYYS